MAALALIKGMPHASNVFSDSEQLLMPHEKYKSRAIV